MNVLTEKIANMSWQTVIIVMVVLLGIWFPLRKSENKHLKSIAETANSLAVALGLVFLIIRPFIIQAFYIPSESMRPTLLEKDHIMVNKFIYRFKEPAFKDVVVFKAPAHASPDNIEKDFIKRVIGVPGDVIRISAGYITVGGVPHSHDDLVERLRVFSKTGEGKVKLTLSGILVDGILVSNKDVATATMDMPEAKVKIFPGFVYKNGVLLKEPYTSEDCRDPYPDLNNERTDPAWIVKDKDGNDCVKIPKGKLLVMGDNRNNSNDARFWGLLDRKRILGKALFKFWPLSRIGLIR